MRMPRMKLETQTAATAARAKREEISNAAAHQHRKPGRLRGDIHEDGAGKENKQEQQLDEREPAGRMRGDGKEAGLAQMRHQFHDGVRVHGA